MVARLGRTHGLRGEFQLHAVTGGRDQLAVGSAVVIADRHRRESWEVHIESVKIRQTAGYIRFKEIADQTTAEKFVQGAVLVPEELLVPLPDGEYYVHQLLGLNVVDESMRPIGILTDVISQANHDVYEIEHEGRRSLVPAVREFIRAIDLPARTMVLRVIPGLLD